ncbi:MAG: hypothetical protein ACYDC3_08725 [Candidatus Binataceae bacterium]
MRINPGPFEPFVYLLQTRGSFRIIGIGGLVLFTIVFVSIAWPHGAGYVIIGLVLLAAMIAARTLGRTGAAVGASETTLDAALAALYILYGLFWIWHRPAWGILFTLWAPLAFLSTTSPAGSSGRASQAE